MQYAPNSNKTYSNKPHEWPTQEQCSLSLVQRQMNSKSTVSMARTRDLSIPSRRRCHWTRVTHRAEANIGNIAVESFQQNGSL